MSEKRIGRQTPTTSLVLPYIETKGKEAVEFTTKPAELLESGRNY